MTASFEGQIIVVTGSTQGIGLETARMLAGQGAEAVVLSGRNATKGQQAAAELQTAGVRALFVPADLSRQEDCFAVIDRSLQTFGRIDCLINCCGSAKQATLDNTTLELWEYIFAVNVRAPFFLIQRAVPSMRNSKRGATITNIGSIAAHGGQPDLSAYSAAKAALVALTKNLANTLRWDRIRVNALNIGWTATPTEHAIQARTHGDDWLQQASANQPFGRLLLPEDVARAILFLASAQSGLMTGSIVDFDQTVIGTSDDDPR
jgi:NAD(P)-dependent dehydrogenase (short-subunit alcohol dehydrogenase family)